MCYFPPGTPPGVVGSNTLEHQADYSSLIYAVSDALFFGGFFQILMFASSYRTVSICVVLRFHYDFEIFYVVYAENLHPINYISQLRYRTSMLVHCTV